MASGPPSGPCSRLTRANEKVAPGKGKPGKEARMQDRAKSPKRLKGFGGGYRNRTGLHGFAIRCIACLPTRRSAARAVIACGRQGARCYRDGSEHVREGIEQEDDRDRNADGPEQDGLHDEAPCCPETTRGRAERFRPRAGRGHKAPRRRSLIAFTPGCSGGHGAGAAVDGAAHATFQRPRCRAYRVNRLYLTRFGSTESGPRRRILSSS